MVRMAEKTLELWIWLPAMVVSAADDGSYEIVYKGRLPRNDPFTTVLVANDQVVPEKQPRMMSSDAAVPKIPDVQPAARPTTAGKSLRLINKLASGTPPLPGAASSCASANLTCVAASKTSNMPTGMIVRSHSSEMDSPPPSRPATTGSCTSSQTKQRPGQPRRGRGLASSAGLSQRRIARSWMLAARSSASSVMISHFLFDHHGLSLLFHDHV
jgi:hypothetical protein